MYHGSPSTQVFDVVHNGHLLARSLTQREPVLSNCPSVILKGRLNVGLNPKAEGIKQNLVVVAVGKVFCNTSELEISTCFTRDFLFRGHHLDRTALADQSETRD